MFMYMAAPSASPVEDNSIGWLSEEWISHRFCHDSRKSSFKNSTNSLEINTGLSHSGVMPIYVNRLLNLKKIKVVGFDMDYTLVPYKIEKFEKLAHSLAINRLVQNYSYPQEVGKLEFQLNRAILGLVIDKRNGNMLKLSRFGKVKIAYHGLEEIDFRERQQIYRERVIDLRDADFQSLDTPFAISNGVLFAQVVQLKKAGMKLPDYRHLACEISACIDSLHKDGTLKSILKADFGEYVRRDPQAAPTLERLKVYGKKLMIITNSDYAYSRILLDYALNPFLTKHKNWQELFDLVITLADKPKFFASPHRFLRINIKTGQMSNHEGPISRGIWQGGWFGDVQEGMGIPGDEFLYLGDHIYGDVVSIKKLCDWRTALILNGLDDELKGIKATHEIQQEIDRLMKRKQFLERQSDNAELEHHTGNRVQNFETQADEQDALNFRISKLLDNLKPHFNPYWGEIFRAGIEESRYAEQVEKYACIYMTKVSDLFEYSPRTYFRPIRRLLAHEIIQ
ncbi:hypothetical protein S1OALGB6SA_1974 [Olavius algarvensis spirochete endosymbiont]|nr:MAG: hypothetical protein [Olavius algarvensis spirochete endosymbiont]VDB00884.1 hypothetical protein S1OALGB6SA_1974 [Olavius algarvensis spirochete endosymbiont]